MSNERPSPDSNGVTDPAVSQAYRETADERVPAELDRAVLNTAADAARPRYARSIAWLRPLAWTATIGLCLVIVLEMSRVPLPEQAIFETPAAASDAHGKKNLPDEIDGADTAERLRQDLDGFAIEAVTDDSAAKFETSLPASTPAPAMPQPHAMKRARSRAPDAESQQTSAAPATESFTVRNPELLRQANELARSYSDTLVETEQPALRSIATEMTGIISIAGDCDEDAIATPSIWVECIEDLEKAGFVAAAQRERERLLRAFPDYELP